jgi:hypothetical protein
MQQLSPEAIRFISTAAKVPMNSRDFTEVVSYLAQGPVTIGLGQRLLSVLSLKWQLRLYVFLGWPISNVEQDKAEQDFEEKSGLEHWQVLRLQMIRAFEYEQNPKRKRKLVEILESF